jgi:hypothetical protein
MSDHLKLPGTSIDGALPVAPSLGPTLDSARIPIEVRTVDARVALLSGLSILVAIAAGFIA